MSLRKLRWAFSNRVVALEVTTHATGYLRPRMFVDVGGQLRRVHSIDHRRAVARVY